MSYWVLILSRHVIELYFEYSRPVMNNWYPGNKPSGSCKSPVILAGLRLQNWFELTECIFFQVALWFLDKVYVAWHNYATWMNWNWPTAPVQHGKCVSFSVKIWPIVWLWTEHTSLLIPSSRKLITWPVHFLNIIDLKLNVFGEACLEVLNFYPFSGIERANRPEYTPFWV